MLAAQKYINIYINSSSFRKKIQKQKSKNEKRIWLDKYGV